MLGTLSMSEAATTMSCRRRASSGPAREAGGRASAPRPAAGLSLPRRGGLPRATALACSSAAQGTRAGWQQSRTAALCERILGCGLALERLAALALEALSFCARRRCLSGRRDGRGAGEARWARQARRAARRHCPGRAALAARRARPPGSRSRTPPATLALPPAAHRRRRAPSCARPARRRGAARWGPPPNARGVDRSGERGRAV